jgi:hypothetical protein
MSDPPRNQAVPDAAEATNYSPTSVETSWPRGMATLAIVVLAVTLFLRMSPAMFQPLRRDEAASVRLYTSFDYVKTMEAMGRESAFDVSRFARGIGKGFLQRWDPNNHLVNSLAITVSCFVFGFSEFAIRLPAFLASMAAVYLLMRLAWRWTGNRWVSSGLGLLLCVNPYSIHYGQTARGYSFMLAMILLQIVLVERGRKRGFTARLNIGMIALSLALFLNTTSLAFAWLAPLCACLLWRSFRDTGGRTGTVADQFKVAWRARDFRLWFWQTCAVAGGILTFVAIKVSEIVSARERYGTKFPQMRELPDVMWHAFQVVFPSWWIAIAMVGLIYGLRSVRRPSKDRWLGPVALLALLAVFAYTAAAYSAPYGRTFGHFLVLALLGCAGLWRWTFGDKTRAAENPFWQPLGLAGLMAACGVGCGQALIKWDDDRVGYNLVAERIKAMATTTSDDSRMMFVPLPAVYGEDMKMYLPDDGALYAFDEDARNITLLIAAEIYGVLGEFQFRIDKKRLEGVTRAFWNPPTSAERFLVYDPPGDQWRVGLFEIPMRVEKQLPAESNSVEWLAVVVSSESEELLLQRAASGGAGGPWGITETRNGRPAIIVFVENRDGFSAMRDCIGAMAQLPNARITILTPETDAGR